MFFECLNPKCKARVETYDRNKIPAKMECMYCKREHEVMVK